MANDIRLRLRDATHVEHQRLEDRLDIFSRIATATARRDLASRFFRFHAGAEAGLAPHLADIEGLDFAARRRTPRLLADLAALGAAVPDDIAPVACESRGAALGFFYVLEGSTLGGRVIRRRMEERGEGMVGLSFLDPYGERGGERWRAFLEVLEREAQTPGFERDAVAGALAGFSQAERTLCAPEGLLS